jgi:hypothetical protein
MDILNGIWRLVDSRAWDEQGTTLPVPYGRHPMGQLMFRNGRMLSALCKGESHAELDGARGYSSYGGPYTFDGATLEVAVDVASDPQRIGGRQTRQVVMLGERMILRPPLRAYGEASQQRELLWERVWRPQENEDAREACAPAGWSAEPRT